MVVRNVLGGEHSVGGERKKASSGYLGNCSSLSAKDYDLHPLLGATNSVGLGMLAAKLKTQ